MILHQIKYLITVGFLLTLNITQSQTSTQYGPDGFIKVENGSGGFMADLESGDRFSRDHDVAGDIDADGVLDLVVGARSDDDGATDAGAVYILFMNTDGTVRDHQKISMDEGDFDETLVENNFFGYGVAGIGDYNNDGIPDIAVSSALSTTNNALYIIHLNNDGTVKDYVKNDGIVSQGLTAIGDLNNDGKIDLVACDPNSNDGGTNRGAISILFLNDASQVITENTIKISSTSGDFGTGLEDGDSFGGREVAILGDIDNDGTKEMAVGAFNSDEGRGAIWILSLDSLSFKVVSKVKIGEGLNGFNDSLSTDVNSNGSFGAQIGHAMCAPGDLNGDGVPDLITGANQQNNGDGYILYLNSDKTVKTHTKINEIDGGFNLPLETDERFSRSISFIGDLRGDGSIAVNFGGGAGGTGTLYLLFFKPCKFKKEDGFNRWANGTTLFTNWDHPSQSITSDFLTFEQCTFKAFETNAAFVTYNDNDGRCICMDDTATLIESLELSTAYSNECFSSVLSINTFIVNNESFITSPNPTNSSIVLTTANTSFTKSDRLQLYNITGTLLYTENIKGQETSVDLSSYPNGVYMLYTNINNNIKATKVIKK